MTDFPDDLILRINGQEISGWQGIRVTTGCERLPSDFEVLLTERYPGEVDALLVQPGDRVEAMIRKDADTTDRILTGFIDRYTSSIDKHAHSVRISGRSKCQDLVDCSAIWYSGQINATSAFDIATKLAGIFDITVDGDPATEIAEGGVIPQINIMWGETPFEIIERIARFRRMLVYDTPDGNLKLSRVGTISQDCGFEEGINVERAQITYSMDQRYSEYITRTLTMSKFEDSSIGVYSDVQGYFHDAGVKAKTGFDGNPRFRPKFIIVENGGKQGPEIARQRGEWEAARRFGRSAQLHLTTSTWRDVGGNLWTPNKLVHLDLPSLKIVDKTWIISEVTFRRDETGTHADLTIMPPQAFEPQPTLMQPVMAEITEGQGQPNGKPQ
ncbi:MAG TPA: Mu P family protein [Patescibacteria group bacterium]|nr:Mu P family protein [Patescibacteria group bacterium]